MNKRGQSTVEFVLTVILFLSVAFFFVRLSLVLAHANYVQYTTFMASRALFSGGASLGESQLRAMTVLNSTTRKADGSARFRWIEGDNSPGPVIINGGFAGANQMSKRDVQWVQGVRYTLKSRVFSIPFLGRPIRSEEEAELTLVSESLLGRHPTRDECIQRISQTLNGRYEEAQTIGYDDNGC